MSWWTDARDQAEKSLGIDTGANAAKTVGNLTAQQIQAGMRGNGDTVTRPTPSASDLSNSRASGPGYMPSFISGGQLSAGALVAIALGAYLIFRRR